MKGHNFCPNCGSNNIVNIQQIVYGTPGIIINSSCSHCGYK